MKSCTWRLDRCLILLTALLLTPAARAQVMMPVEVPLEQASARLDGEQVVLQRILAESVMETREEAYPVTVKVVKKEINPATKEEQDVFVDVTEMRTRTVVVPRKVYKQIVMPFRLEGLQAAELSGAKLDAAALKARLEKPALVLVTNGIPVPENFKLLFKPETIVVDLAQSMGAIMMAAPVPIAPRAEPDPAPPAAGDLPPLSELPPVFRLASIDADDQFVLKATRIQNLTSTRYVMKTEIKLHEGKEVPVTICAPIQAMERQETTHTVAFPVGAVSGHSVEGNSLEDLHRAALRQREIPVVVAASDQPVHKYWLQSIKPKMLVLNVPTSLPPTPAAPLPFAPALPVPGPAPSVPTAP